MEDSIIILLCEAAKISDYVKPGIYKTILGQIRSGNLAGAAKGIRRIQRRHARKNGNGARKDRKRGRKKHVGNPKKRNG